MKGFFDLRTSRDLFDKLESDFTRLKAEPINSHVAFDFFVTAWHLVEWHIHLPAERTAFCNENPVLNVCEHLAVGAKHFAPRNPRLTSVATTGNTSVWVPKSWSVTAWAQGAWASELVVHLDGPARATFGEIISVVQLAEATMGVWRRVFLRESTE
jgi:hypothetical protein